MQSKDGQDIMTGSLFKMEMGLTVRYTIAAMS